MIGAPVASVRGLSGAGFVEDVSFDLRAGEILGFFGLVGAGRSEVAQMLFGITRPDRRRDPARRPHGSTALAAGRLAARHLAAARGPPPPGARARVPDPGQRDAARCCAGWPTGSAWSIAGPRRSSPRTSPGGCAWSRPGSSSSTSTLSGGNQQKVLLAKWLIPAPRVLILDQPTRGIDVGAKAEIHRIVSHLATEGIAIILICDDAAEVSAMADRILVFRGGRVVAEFAREVLRSGGDAARRRACRARSRGRQPGRLGHERAWRDHRRSAGPARRAAWSSAACGCARSACFWRFSCSACS